MTAAEELVLVDAAIARGLRAESYTDGPQSLKRPNLDALYRRKRELEQLIAAQTPGSGGLAHNYVRLRKPC